MRRLNYVGVTFRTRSRDEVRQLVSKLRADIWNAVEAGTLNVPIDKVFAFYEVVAALDYMSANKHFGKIVLRM